MIENLSPIPVNTAHTANVSSEVSPARNRDEDSSSENIFAFSLTSAMTTLERNAARALEVHGATPEGSTNLRSQSQSRETAKTEQTQPSSELPNNRETIENNATQKNKTQKTQTTLSAGEQTSKVLSLRSIASLSLKTNATIANGQLTQNVINQARPGSQATIATQGIQKPSATQVQQAASKPPTTATTPQNDFAKLLANRFANGETRFEVRLDPPELGRVDVKLLAGEKSTLTLSFEQQSTLDLFRRDADALRALIVDSGLDESSTFDVQYEMASEHGNSRNSQEYDRNSNQFLTIPTNDVVSLIIIPQIISTVPYAHTSIDALFNATNTTPLVNIQV